nr:phage scaffolding protein [uncultured Solibaculum sp.]
MKNIFDILSSLGIEIPEDKKDALEKELAANYKTVAEYDKQAGKLSQALDKLKTAEDGLKAFEGVDVTDLQGQIAKLQGDLSAKDAAYAEKVANMEFDALLTSAVTAARGKNAKAIRALLDVDALKSSKNQEADIQAALEALQKDNEYLFESDKEPLPNIVLPAKVKEPVTVTKESFAKMGYRERVAIKKENPELYEQLKE